MDLKSSILRRGDARRIFSVLIVSAAWRVGLLAWAYVRTGTRVMTQGDSASYIEPARSLLRNGSFADSGVAEIDRTPGYPVFAMLTGMVSGHVVLTAAVQIGLSLLSVLLVCRIANLTFAATRPGILAAWFLAFEPISIIYSVRIMPETLFLLLLLIAIERVIAFQQGASFSSAAVAAAAIGAATYVRPVGYYLVPVLALCLLLPRSRKDVKWKAVLLFLLVVLPCIGAWRLRNFRVAGYNGFSSVVEKNLYFYQAAGVQAQLDHVSLSRVQGKLGYGDDSTYAAAHPEQAQWSRVQQLRFMHQEAVSLLLSHPEVTLENQLAGSAIVAFTPSAAEFLQLIGLSPSGSVMPNRVLSEGVLRSASKIITAHWGIAMIMALFEAYLVCIYVLGSYGALKGHGVIGAIITLIATSLYFLAVSGGAQAVGRYRLPIMPELCVLAAGGVMQIQSKRQSSKNPAFAIRLEATHCGD